MSKIIKKELDSKAQAISILYLKQAIYGLEKERKEFDGIEKENIEYDINCIERLIEYLK